MGEQWINAGLPATVELDAQYFASRSIRLDTRGPLTISKDSHWGFFITVITQSHSLAGQGVGSGGWFPVINRPVIVERNAWICSGAWLYNCKIGEGAVVSIGTVVRSQEVKPYVMVAGNPARVMARFVDGVWVYERPRYEILE
jgi:acetyltransferase-like isoleucine patch superfamily enzyme